MFPREYSGEERLVMFMERHPVLKILAAVGTTAFLYLLTVAFFIVASPK